MITGVIMAYIRVREPYFWFIIKKHVLECFGELMDEKSVAK
jgi:hypothetical protein